MGGGSSRKALASMAEIKTVGIIGAGQMGSGIAHVSALAGYGVAARLEYIMVPIAFGFGTALTTMVATNMGAGQHERALRACRFGGRASVRADGSLLF